MFYITLTIYVCTLPAKIWNIFLFSDFFFHFCGVCRLVMYLKYIATGRYYFWGSKLAFNRKMKRKGSKTIISAFSSLRLWLEFLLSLCQIAAYSFVCCIEILCIIPLCIYRHFWYSQQEINVVGASHRRTWAVVLVYHKVMYTKS